MGSQDCSVLQACWEGLEAYSEDRRETVKGSLLRISLFLESSHGPIRIAEAGGGELIGKRKREE